MAPEWLCCLADQQSVWYQYSSQPWVFLMIMLFMFFAASCIFEHNIFFVISVHWGCMVSIIVFKEDVSTIENGWLSSYTNQRRIYLCYPPRAIERICKFCILHRWLKRMAFVFSGSLIILYRSSFWWGEPSVDRIKKSDYESTCD